MGDTEPSGLGVSQEAAKRITLSDIENVAIRKENVNSATIDAMLANAEATGLQYLEVFGDKPEPVAKRGVFAGILPGASRKSSSDHSVDTRAVILLAPIKIGATEGRMGQKKDVMMRVLITRDGPQGIRNDPNITEFEYRRVGDIIEEKESGKLDSVAYNTKPRGKMGYLKEIVRGEETSFLLLPVNDISGQEGEPLKVSKNKMSDVSPAQVKEAIAASIELAKTVDPNLKKYAEEQARLKAAHDLSAAIKGLPPKQ